MEIIYKISGYVERGKGYGRRLGFPTANLSRDYYIEEKLSIPLGVYSGTSTIGGISHISAIVIGPIDKTGYPKIESHLINYSGDLYEKKIDLILNKFLRPFKEFSSEKELIVQIKKDVSEISG